MQGFPALNNCGQMVMLAESASLTGWSVRRWNARHYQRPFLQADGQDDAKFLLRRPDWFAAHDIELLDGRMRCRLIRCKNS
jgi:hypothetical protein